MKEQSNLRSLLVLKKNTDFTSNDYLGLARSAELHNMISNAVAAMDIPRNGSTGSRLLCGNSANAEKLEHRLSGLLNCEAALLFNSGYSANLAVLSALPQKGDTIIHDEHAHASLKDGARLSHATKWNFKHNDLNDLEKKLKSAAGNRWVVVESIYSMDGDQCPLTELALLANQYQANIVLDEAHSTGVVGKNGNGLANSMGLEKNFPVRVYTFGKAMGVHGACVAGSRKLIDYLINFSRPFIYTTALPDHALISIGASFDFLEKNVHLQNALQNVTQEFIRLRNKMELRFVQSQSQIQAIVVPGNEQVKRIAQFLQQADFDVRPILSPTVKEGSERLRICLHAFNKKEEIELFAHTLGKFEMQA